jgi:hypothetical protein
VLTPEALHLNTFGPASAFSSQNRMSRGFQTFTRSVFTRYSTNRFAHGSSADGIVRPSAIAV